MLRKASEGAVGARAGGCAGAITVTSMRPIDSCGAAARAVPERAEFCPPAGGRGLAGMNPADATGLLPAPVPVVAGDVSRAAYARSRDCSLAGWARESAGRAE